MSNTAQAFIASYASEALSASPRHAGIYEAKGIAWEKQCLNFQKMQLNFGLGACALSNHRVELVTCPGITHHCFERQSPDQIGTFIVAGFDASTASVIVPDKGYSYEMTIVDEDNRDMNIEDFCVVAFVPIGARLTTAITPQCREGVYVARASVFRHVAASPCGGVPL